jgi:Holliday junction resolvasome RuvABC DNA-binding subunit
MLARVTGNLETLEGNRALIAPSDQPSAAYEVLLPAYLAQRLNEAESVGSPVTLHTLQYLESVNQGSSFIPRLLGFASPHERAFFELLTTVKGLGNKRALRAMALEPGTIARAIAERDTRFLQRLPEIGPKLAELIVHELKSKADPYITESPAHTAAPVPAAPASQLEPKSPATSNRPKAGPPSSPPPSRLPASTPSPLPPIRQTVDALIALGESPIDAERMVARALDRARAAGAPTPATPEDLLTAAYTAR